MAVAVFVSLFALASVSAPAGAKTVDSVAVTPNLQVQATAANHALQGTNVPLSIVATNPSATLATTGSFGYTGALFTNSVVKAWWIAVEYRGTGSTWTPLAGVQQVAGGYTPTQAAPATAGLSVTATPKPAYGVTYPSSGDPVIGTKVSGLFGANWNLAVSTSQSAATILRLLSSSQTSEVRIRTRIEAARTGLFGIQTQDAKTTTSTITRMLRSQSASATNVRLVVTGDGRTQTFTSPSTPQLASIPAGGSATVAATVALPSVAPKSASETDAAYLARLKTAAAQSVSAATATTFTAGGIAAPWCIWLNENDPPFDVGSPRIVNASGAQSAVGLDVPVVEIQKTGPAQIGSGQTANYSITAKNTGDAAATAQASDQVDGQASASISGIGQLAAGAQSNGTHSYDVPANFQQNSIHDRASVTWTDSAARPYGPVSADFTSSVIRDTTPPVAPTVTVKPTSLTSSTDARFEFTGESSGTFRCSLDGATAALCTSPAIYAGLSQGPHSFSVLQVDAASNVGSSAGYSWTVDSIAPGLPAFSGVPYDPTRLDKASISFTGESGGTYECKLDAGAYASCTSPEAYTALSDGVHVFNVRQSDAAGNVGAAAQAQWTVDRVAPDAPSLTATPDAVTRETSAGFGFAGEPGGRFECSLDAATFASCVNPVSYQSLGDGHHDFEVRQIDGADNVGAASQFGWTIDRSPPAAPTLTLTPAAQTRATTVQFSFTGENGGMFQCALDAAQFTDCTSPASYQQSTDGDYTFNVRQTDDAGNVGSVATYVWTLDRAAPAAPQLSGAPNSPTKSASASISISGEPGASYECTLDGAGWQTCASPAQFTALTEGQHTLAVRQTDPAGNVGTAAQAQWTVDLTAPDKPTISAHPDSLTSAVTAELHFSGEPGGAFECRLDGGVFSACTNPKSYDSLTEAQHTFEVRQVDDAGNQGDPESFGWTIDPHANQCVAPGGGSKTVTAIAPAGFGRGSA